MVQSWYQKTAIQITLIAGFFVVIIVLIVVGATKQTRNDLRVIEEIFGEYTRTEEQNKALISSYTKLTNEYLSLSKDKRIPNEIRSEYKKLYEETQFKLNKQNVVGQDRTHTAPVPTHSQLSTQLEFLKTKMQWNSNDANSVLFLGTISLGLIIFAVPLLSRVKSPSPKYKGWLIAGALTLFLSGIFFVDYAREQLVVGNKAGASTLSKLLDNPISADSLKIEIKKIRLWDQKYELMSIEMPFKGAHVFRFAKVFQYVGFIIFICLFISGIRNTKFFDQS